MQGFADRYQRLMTAEGWFQNKNSDLINVERKPLSYWVCWFSFPTTEISRIHALRTSFQTAYPKRNKTKPLSVLLHSASQGDTQRAKPPLLHDSWPAEFCPGKLASAASAERCCCWWRCTQTRECWKRSLLCPIPQQSDAQFHWLGLLSQLPGALHLKSKDTVITSAIF